MHPSINLTWERLDERTVRSRQTIDGARVYIRTMRVGYEIVHHGCTLGTYAYEDIPSVLAKLARKDSTVFSIIPPVLNIKAESDD